MNKISIKQKQLLISRLFIPGVVLVFALILTLGYFAVLSGPYDRLAQTKNDKWPAIQRRLAQLNQEIKMLSGGTVPGSAFTAEEQRLLSQVLPDEADITSITVQLTNLAKEYGFVVTGVTVATNGAAGQPADGANGNSRLKSATIKAGFSGGTYYDFKRLLAALESSVMIFDVHQLEFSGDATDYSLELTTYYYSDTATAPVPAKTQ